MTMTDLDDRLARLGRHLDDERHARLHASRDMTAAMTAQVRRPTSTPKRRRLAQAGAVAVMVVGIAISVAVGLGDDHTNLASTAPELPAPVQVPVGAPAPGTVAPYAAEPPDWFGDPLDGRRPAAERMIALARGATSRSHGLRRAAPARGLGMASDRRPVALSSGCQRSQTIDPSSSFVGCAGWQAL